MPSGHVLHEADALALHGVGQQHDAVSPGVLLAASSASTTCWHVVAVDATNVPAKAAVLLLQRLDVHHFGHRSVDLQAVAVDDGRPGCRARECVACHGRFPDLPFLLLAVAHDAEVL